MQIFSQFSIKYDEITPNKYQIARFPPLLASKKQALSLWIKDNLNNFDNYVFLYRIAPLNWAFSLGSVHPVYWGLFRGPPAGRYQYHKGKGCCRSYCTRTGRTDKPSLRDMKSSQYTYPADMKYRSEAT